MWLKPEAEGIGEFARWGFTIEHRQAGCLVQEEYSNRRIGHLYWCKGEPFTLGVVKCIHVFGHSYPACSTVPRCQYVTSRWYPNREGLEHQLDEVSAEASKSQSLEVEKSISPEVNKSRSQKSDFKTYVKLISFKGNISLEVFLRNRDFTRWGGVGVEQKRRRNGHVGN